MKSWTNAMGRKVVSFASYEEYKAWKANLEKEFPLCKEKSEKNQDAS